LLTENFAYVKALSQASIVNTQLYFIGFNLTETGLRQGVIIIGIGER
jgi:hypothetical protein